MVLRNFILLTICSIFHSLAFGDLINFPKSDIDNTYFDVELNRYSSSLPDGFINMSANYPQSYIFGHQMGRTKIDVSVASKTETRGPRIGREFNINNDIWYKLRVNFSLTSTAELDSQLYYWVYVWNRYFSSPAAEDLVLRNNGGVGNRVFKKAKIINNKALNESAVRTVEVIFKKSDSSDKNIRFALFSSHIFPPGGHNLDNITADLIPINPEVNINTVSLSDGKVIYNFKTGCVGDSVFDSSSLKMYIFPQYKRKGFREVWRTNVDKSRPFEYNVCKSDETSFITLDQIDNVCGQDGADCEYRIMHRMEYINNFEYSKAKSF